MFLGIRASGQHERSSVLVREEGYCGNREKMESERQLRAKYKSTGNFKFDSLAVGRAQAKTRRAHTCNKLSGPVQEKFLIFMSFKPNMKYGQPGMTCSDSKFIPSLSITGGSNQEVSRKGITVEDTLFFGSGKVQFWAPEDTSPQ